MRFSFFLCSFSAVRDAEEFELWELSNGLVTAPCFLSGQLL